MKWPRALQEKNLGCLLHDHVGLKSLNKAPVTAIFPADTLEYQEVQIPVKNTHLLRLSVDIHND